MKKIHKKSLCCKAKIVKFGYHRRQCSVCKKTWRIYLKQRGRKKKRLSPDFLLSYLKQETPSISALSRVRKKSEDAYNRRLKESLKKYNEKTKWPTLPTKGELIVIADAMVWQVNNRTYTCYLILLREVSKREAIITKPLFRKGQEVAAGWHQAFSRLSPGIRKRIKVIVSDGHTGLLSVAHYYGWIIQRCHFHLIARMDGYQTSGKLSRHGKLGQQIYLLVKTILISYNEPKIISCLEQLKLLLKTTNSRWLKTTMSGFIKHYQNFRTYIYYPELNLPRTSNAAESLVSLIRRFNNRSRGYRTLKSFRRWVWALLKNKQKIVCNGSKNQPNKCG